MCRKFFKIKSGNVFTALSKDVYVDAYVRNKTVYSVFQKSLSLSYNTLSKFELGAINKKNKFDGHHFSQKRYSFVWKFLGVIMPYFNYILCT